MSAEFVDAMRTAGVDPGVAPIIADGAIRRFRGPGDVIGFVAHGQYYSSAPPCFSIPRRNRSGNFAILAAIRRAPAGDIRYPTTRIVNAFSRKNLFEKILHGNPGTPIGLLVVDGRRRPVFRRGVRHRR